MTRLEKILMILGTIVTPLTFLGGIIYELYALQCFITYDFKGFVWNFFVGLWFLFWGRENYKNARDYWRRFLDERQDN